METVVHQALGHVFRADAGGFFERPQIQNAFMRHPAVVAGVQRGVVVAQFVADVVGRQNRRLGGVLQALRAHHAAVHPADRQHRRVT